jgi:hypothetical protein
MGLIYIWYTQGYLRMILFGILHGWLILFFLVHNVYNVANPFIQMGWIMIHRVHMLILQVYHFTKAIIYRF